MSNDMRFEMIAKLLMLPLLLPVSVASAQLPKLDVSFDSARVSTRGDQLTITTGVFTRQWRLTPVGLATTSLSSGDRRRIAAQREIECDWDLDGLHQARLTNLVADEHDDQGFTSPHLRVIAEFEYPDDHLGMRYVIWAYPGAPGLRTQLQLRSLDAVASDAAPSSLDPEIRPIDGKASTLAGAKQVVRASLATNLFHEKAVRFEVVGLDSQQTYMLGLSWWDWDGGGRTQRVQVASVDGEKTAIIVPGRRLPSWKTADEMPEELTTQVPNEVMLDGTFVVSIDKLTGPNANVSELWLYVKDDQTTDRTVQPGAMDRLAELDKLAPDGYRLVAYHDCGGHVASSKQDSFATQIVETTPVDPDWGVRHAFGLMQGIKTTSPKSLLREEQIGDTKAAVNWANGVLIQGENAGVIVVKESNKHTGLRPADDVATGGFVIGQDQVQVTGVGLERADVPTDRYRSGWATWTLMYAGDAWDGNLALKKFDRARFPIQPDRDIYIMANTWGSEDLRPACLHAACEENVLAELESVADLGIDVLQVDDGWQTPEWKTARRSPEVQRGEWAVKAFGDYAVYPEGWANIRAKAKQLGVTLGLWAAWTAPVEMLKANCDEGGFKYFKLDFARLDSRDAYDSLVEKARELIAHTDHTARVNWDVTELAPRMGYFTGREYGNIYLENRKTRTAREPVLYVPHKVLADAWQLAKYVNLNKFQVTVQNVDHVLPDVKTDAALHSHAYAIGIALMASPIFFQETHYYEGAARDQVRQVLSVYKHHREVMYRGYVFPIGAFPDNRSWTGFQNHDPETGTGYLTVFRERLNESSSGRFKLHFIDRKSLRVTNLLTKDVSDIPVGDDGSIEFQLAQAPGFLYLRYE